MLRTLLKKLASPILLIVFLAVMFSPFCGWMYQCGCTYLWNGADAHCNVHAAGTPDCPWCVTPSVFAHKADLAQVAQLIPFIIVLVSGIISVLVYRRFSQVSGLWKECLIGAGASFIVANVVGLIYRSVLGYPFFWSF